MTVDILIVDDDINIRFILKEFLSEFILLEASNGEEAVTMYQTYQPKIVLIDLMMPIMNGFEATKKIITLNPNAIIIGLSAFATTQGKDLLLAGAKEVIPKPCDFLALKKKISKYLQSNL